MADHISDAMEGHSVTIFAFGGTAAGKSFTMHGSKSAPGIVPRAIEDVFRRRDAAMAADPDLFIHIDVR